MLGILMAVFGGVVAGQFHGAVGIAPVLAGLLCASCFLRPRAVGFVGIAAALVYDLCVGLSSFTAVRLAAMLSVVGVVRLLRIRFSLPSLAMGIALASTAYHLSLAVGDWVTQTCSTQPHTMQGLLATIGSSLPYFQRAFFGEALCTVAFFGVYTFAGYAATLRWPSLRSHPLEG